MGLKVATAKKYYLNQIDEQAILKNAEILCKPTFKYLNIQIEKDPPTTWFLSKRNK